VADIIEGLVSVIIPVYNRPKQIVEAVESVLTQTYEKYEIIVVDDGSNDETPDVLKSLESLHQGTVRIFRKKKGGPGRAREHGRVHAKGEFVQYLDSDDILLPEKFRLQIQKLHEHQDAEICYGKTRYRNRQGQTDNSPIKATGEEREFLFPKLLVDRWWDTSTPLFKRSIIDKCGPWTSLKNEEDWEYEARMARFSPKLVYCNEFVSETRDTDDNRLCRDEKNLLRKFRHRSLAHRLIVSYAIDSSVDLRSFEMRHMAKDLFLLGRQCAAVGLKKESIKLVKCSKKISKNKEDGWKYCLFDISATFLGYQLAGKLFSKLDKIRTSV